MSADGDDGAVTAATSQDNSFTSLLRFVDVASTRIRQALDRPRRCRRRVNHRKYLARIHSGCTPANDRDLSRHRACRSNSPSASQSGCRSKRRPPRSVDERHSETGAAAGGSRSFGRQRPEHTSAGTLARQLADENSVAVCGESPRTGLPRRRGPAVSSAAHGSSPLNDVPCHGQQPYWMTSTRITATCDSRYFPHQPAAVCLPRQPQLRSELDSWYHAAGVRRCPSAAMMRHAPVEDYCNDCSSSHRQWFATQHLRDNTSSCRPPIAVQQQMPSSARWPTDVSWGSTLRYDQNDNDYYCLDYSCVTSPPAYNPHVFSHDTRNPASLQHQSTTMDFHLPCNLHPTAADLFVTPTTRLFADCVAAHGQNSSLVVDEPSSTSFNDSGLGSCSFGSATDIDGSSSMESSFIWPYNHGIAACAETFRDSPSVQTIL